MAEIIAQRDFNMPYIFLDTAFLCILSALLIAKGKYRTFIFGFLGGLLYQAVDFGYFYLISHTRTIFVDGVLQGDGGTFLVLFWMSMSYGFTNFVWIWLCLSRDTHIKEWTILIFGWWICCPMISNLFVGATSVRTVRTTGAYHGYMAAIMIISYLIVIAYNLFQKQKELRWRIVWLFIVGVAIQFGWEFGLLIGGIRSDGIAVSEQIRTLITNSLVETNLGMPLIYIIYLSVSTRVKENLRLTKRMLKEVLIENNKQDENTRFRWFS